LHDTFTEEKGEMIGFFASLFHADLMSRGIFLGHTRIPWLHAISDTMIALAYFSIPLSLVKFVRRRKQLTFRWTFWMLSAFIFLCGTTHILNVVMIWEPVYLIEGIVKLATGIVALITAVALLRFLPRALALPLPDELAAVNRALAEQIAINRRTEESLRRLNGELEGRVAQRTAALERSNQELRQFAYVASHDLQEPLRMVSNYTGLLKRRYESQLDRQAREFIQYAADGARRMQELITDLLNYAQIDRSEVNFHEVEVEKAVDRAINALRLLIQQQHAHLDRKPLPRVEGDEGQLAQLFQNLISNSLKYRSRATPEVKIWAEPLHGTGMWKFFVQDNGIGFDMKFKDRLFNMFQRLDSSQPGTGIGLAMCRKIVDRHGGKIDVESVEGQGSTFFFTLPATRVGRTII
jgi:signal transduction histidine kinase